MGWRSGYPRYVSVSERKAKAKRQAEKLAKKIGDLQPVSVSGRTLAKSWWGKAWNQNLERYSDYANRLPRGRSYLTNGMVLDLQIEKETIRGIVAGSSSSPYQVTIRIQVLPEGLWKRLVQQAAGKIESLAALLEGRFPEELKEVFFEKDRGLFPSPDQIQLSCSCPDWAVMCKHVAAVLYGVGARLDKEPQLLFTLRGVNTDELVRLAAESETEKLLKRTPAASSRIIETNDGIVGELSELFGIQLAEKEPKARSASPKTRSTKRERKKTDKEKPTVKRGRKAASRSKDA